MMKLEGVYQSAVKCSLLFLLVLGGAFGVCVVLDLTFPTPLAFLAVAVLYLLLTPSILLHLPLADGEFLPLPASPQGWLLGAGLVLFMLFTISLVFVLAWRFLRVKQ
ncbi:hypothetical protein HPC38_00130 [Pasteurellaceae bacterium HPA106]|uniref:hypothetical protein n=1 Tax=Spirabiliibacterium pneumoniae TaxID=221400 RepID=UPI001AAC52F3|nr:hypothetical protein [Spirabiliibacterium pneumoniae]MBE2895292.1 hypothetical protein [Spirabiliibacterium pneumoniae]